MKPLLFSKLQKMSGKTLQYHHINLHLELSSYLHESVFYEELYLFRKIIQNDH
jgi:hypothetical protein